MFARALTGAASAALMSLASALCADAANCTVTAAPPVFANYSPTSGNAVTGTGSITVSCTLALTATVSLSTGSGTFAARTMLGPSNAKLGYNLYTNVGLSTVWGDGTAGTATPSVVLSLLNLTSSMPLYGSISGGQDVPVGTYSDSLTTTVSF